MTMNINNYFSPFNSIRERNFGDESETITGERRAFAVYKISHVKISVAANDGGEKSDGIKGFCLGFA